MLIVGLGNPGNEYAMTRHNAGWIIVEELAKDLGLSFSNEKKHKSYVSRGVYNGKKVTLLLPLTYMNLSGNAVQSLANYYNYSSDEIIIVYDDKDFDLGVTKIRFKGSAGSHNGIKSTISSLGTQDFIRVRVGIGPKPDRIPLSNFVLAKFRKSEQQLFEDVTYRGVDIIKSILDDGLEDSMQKYNKK